MKKAVVITKSEVRQILANYFNVPIEDVWPSKFSFTVVQDDGKEWPEAENTSKMVQKSGTYNVYHFEQLRKNKN